MAAGERDQVADPRGLGELVVVVYRPVLLAAELGQDDRDTLAALIGRLDRTGDPEWLKGDMIGALTALTGQRFGYDIAAWRRWWASRRP